MSRFIFRCTAGTVSDATVQTWNNRTDVNVLEHTARMLLVETSSRIARQLAEESPDMIYTPERTSAHIPDTRPRLNGEPT